MRNAVYEFTRPQVDESGFGVISSGRSYKCCVDGCTNRVLGYGDRCCECLDEDLMITAARSPQAARMDRRERWDGRVKAALEMWVALQDWFHDSRLVTWILAIFVIGGWAYICLVYGLAFLKKAQ